MSSIRKYEISDDSLTEDHETLLGKGMRWKTGTWLQKKYGVHHVLIAAIAGAASTAAVLLLGLSIWTNSDKVPFAKKHFEPSFPYDIPRTFYQDPTYTGNDSNWHEPWDALQPPGHGFIRIKNPQQYGLPDAVNIGPNEFTYAIAMFHQIHCLGSLKRDRQALLTGAVRVEIEHSDHCFDYLRQSIMCHGDMTLEATYLLPGQTMVDRQVDGWGTVHMCRNWDLMVDWANEWDDHIRHVDHHMAQHKSGLHGS